MQVHITNASNLPVEAIEMEFPLRVESYGLIRIAVAPASFAAEWVCVRWSPRLAMIVCSMAL